MPRKYGKGNSSSSDPYTPVSSEQYLPKKVEEQLILKISMVQMRKNAIELTSPSGDLVAKGVLSLSPPLTFPTQQTFQISNTSLFHQPSLSSLSLLLSECPLKTSLSHQSFPSSSQISSKMDRPASQYQNTGSENNPILLDDSIVESNIAFEGKTMADALHKSVIDLTFALDVALNDNLSVSVLTYFENTLKIARARASLHLTSAAVPICPPGSSEVIMTIPVSSWLDGKIFKVEKAIQKATMGKHILAGETRSKVFENVENEARDALEEVSTLGGAPFPISKMLKHGDAVKQTPSKVKKTFNNMRDSIISLLNRNQKQAALVAEATMIHQRELEDEINKINHKFDELSDAMEVDDASFTGVDVKSATSVTVNEEEVSSPSSPPRKKFQHFIRGPIPPSPLSQVHVPSDFSTIMEVSQDENGGTSSSPFEPDSEGTPAQAPNRQSINLETPIASNILPASNNHYVNTPSGNTLSEFEPQVMYKIGKVLDYMHNHIPVSRNTPTPNLTIGPAPQPQTSLSILTPASNNNFQRASEPLSIGSIHFSTPNSEQGTAIKSFADQFENYNRVPAEGDEEDELVEESDGPPLHFEDLNTYNGASYSPTTPIIRNDQYYPTPPQNMYSTSTPQSLEGNRISGTPVDQSPASMVRSEFSTPNTIAEQNIFARHDLDATTQRQQEAITARQVNGILTQQQRSMSNATTPMSPMPTLFLSSMRSPDTVAMQNEHNEQTPSKPQAENTPEVPLLSPKKKPPLLRTVLQREAEKAEIAEIVNEFALQQAAEDSYFDGDTSFSYDINTSNANRALTEMGIPDGFFKNDLNPPPHPSRLSNIHTPLPALYHYPRAPHLGEKGTSAAASNVARSPDSQDSDDSSLVGMGRNSAALQRVRVGLKRPANFRRITEDYGDDGEEEEEQEEEEQESLRKKLKVDVAKSKKQEEQIVATKKAPVEEMHDNDDIVEEKKESVGKIGAVKKIDDVKANDGNMEEVKTRRSTRTKIPKANKFTQTEHPSEIRRTTRASLLAAAVITPSAKASKRKASEDRNNGKDEEEKDRQIKKEKATKATKSKPVPRSSPVKKTTKAIKAITSNKGGNGKVDVSQEFITVNTDSDDSEMSDAEELL
jgi:hypothetical protein